MSSPGPRITMDELEARAAAERQRLQQDVSELRQTVRERLDVKRNVRDHLGLAALAAALLGLALGYLTAAAFNRANPR